MGTLTTRCRRLVAIGVAAGALTSPAVAGAATTTSNSTNWAGYAVTGQTFKRVSGSWTQPTVDCSTSSSASYSATWVGLGGYSESSTALEQIGTEANCENGVATYDAWYELVPEASRPLSLKIRAGDRVAASVTVSGSTVRMRLTNLTTGKSVLKVRTTTNLDLSSAEWIQETPSTCDASGSRCQVLPLADFDTVTFRNAYATTKAGQKASINSTLFSTSRINLIETATDARRYPGDQRTISQASGTGATTGDLNAAGTSFVVDYADSLTTTTTATRAAARRSLRTMPPRPVASF